MMARNTVRLLHLASCILLASVTLAATACQPSANASTLSLSGVIEATQATVVAEVGGRVIEIAVDEGDAVQAGQALVRLDDAALQVQVKQAQAAVGAAEANLAQVKSGARREDIAVMQAALAQAQAERDGAALAYRDALKILDNPQQLLAQTDAARAAVQVAQQSVAAAQSKVAEARWWRDFYDDDPGRHRSLDKQIAIAQYNLEAAQAQLDGADAQVKALQAMHFAPVALRAQVNSASGNYSVTLASLAVAEAALVELKAGATPEEIALAEAQLSQAQAQLKLAQAYRARAVVHAPLTGLVVSRSARVGETAQPGVALMTIADLDEVTLVVYVPQAELPRLQLGAPAQVSVDAYPGQVFTGQVTSIARQAQFTPRDIQASQDRTNVVFAVKVRLPNADHRLKAGMTGDVMIAVQTR